MYVLYTHAYLLFFVCDIQYIQYIQYVYVCNTPYFGLKSAKSTVSPSIPDTLRPERTVLIVEVSSFYGLKMSYG